MKEYMIKPETLAILPFGRKNSIVYENDEVYLINKRPNAIIRSNCMLHGSTFEGRLDGTKQLTGYSYKAPVLIEDKNNIIFFPTSSPRLKDCSWINIDLIDDCMYDSDEKVSIIKFNNNKMLKFNISRNILNNQILKATRFELKIKKNKLKTI